MSGRLMELLLRVENVQRSVAFYRDVLGLSVEPGDDAASHFEVFWGRWEPEAADLVMFLIYPTDSDHPKSVCELGFSVPNLDVVHVAVVKSGQPVLEEPSPKSWGMQATFRDPDGNVVAVAQSPMSIVPSGS